MKKLLLGLLGMLFFSLSSNSETLEYYDDFYYDDYLPYSTSVVVPTVPTTNEVISQTLMKINELRTAIAELRDALMLTEDPLLKKEIECQIDLYEKELESLPVLTVQTNVTVYNQVYQLLSNIMKSIQDTLLNIIRNLR